MTSDEVLALFDGLNVWRRGDPQLTALLREFGPSHRSDHSEQPFWRLKNDGVWTVLAPVVHSRSPVVASRLAIVRIGLLPTVCN